MFQLGKTQISLYMAESMDMDVSTDVDMDMDLGMDIK
jgi:hypothetical protein